MWYQFVNDAANEEHSSNNARALFLEANPLVITALVEDAWRHSQPENNITFPAWPAAFTQILRADFDNDFVDRYGHHPFMGARNHPPMLHHLIYAYLIESTGIYAIFRKVLQTYNTSEDQLDAPRKSTQRFWGNTG